MTKIKKEGAFRNFDWKTFFDRFHVYGGLFIAFYLVILGISSLMFQHHFKLPESQSTKVWEQSIKIPEIEDKQQYKLAIRDSLGLFGGTPWWQDYKDDNGVHHFMIARPGKQYWIEVPLEGSTFKVKEIRKGFINVAIALHGLTGGGLEGPYFIKVWKFIGQVMNIVFLIVLGTTIYFWYERSLKHIRAGLSLEVFCQVQSLYLFSYGW